jgi:DNA repair exonuclease SbcCD ATPase subunit
MYGMSSRLLGAAAAAVLVLLAAACGGGGGNPTTSTAAGGTPAEAWASGICSSFTTWKNSLESIKTDVTTQPSESQIRQAGRDFDSATKTLTQSLKQLGTPDTAQGQAAKESLDTLVTTLDNGMNKIDDALSSSGGVLSQISTISATLATMASDLKLAGANLDQLAPSGELQQAFRQAGACKQYVH